MSSQLVLLALRAVLAGGFVVLISLLSNALSPKFFAGLFAGAPTVALVSLSIIAVTRPASLVQTASGMVLGAVAMLVAFIGAALAEPRVGAVLASAAAWGVWFAVALGLYLLVP